MTHHTMSPASSERGVAIIVVLLLLVVMSGLVTGLSYSGRIEAAMADNEVSYAGARASAEAGMNRAIEAITNNTSTNFLSGADGLVDATNPAATVNADNGLVGFLMTGTSPYTLGTSGQYSYTIRIFDDDDPVLYPTPLTAAQLTAMGENGSAYVSTNDRLILRATGNGPKSTTVSLSRILENVGTMTTTTTTTTTITNPAILINGNMTISGDPALTGQNGSIHANGNLSIAGSPTISTNATASNTFTAPTGWRAGGSQGGGRPTITVPNIDAANYIQHADFFLQADGMIRNAVTGVVAPPSMSWTFSSAGWRLSGVATPGTYYAYTPVNIENTASAKAPVALSVIATGSIRVSGNAYLKPENTAALQFVTNGDLKLEGNLTVTSAVEGQSLVREQLSMEGNSSLRGQMIVQNVPSVSSLLTTNSIGGGNTVIYDGSFPGISMTTTTTSPGPMTYVNNVSGWLEGQ